MQDRKPYIDIIRICACMGVVALHVTGNYMRDSLPENNTYCWWISFIVNMLTRIAVPLFIVISGYLNLGRNIRYELIVRKSIVKIILPLFLFGIVNILYWNWFFKLSQDITFFFLVKEFVSGPMMFHLWFLYMISLAQLYCVKY